METVKRTVIKATLSCKIRAKLIWVLVTFNIYVKPYIRQVQFNISNKINTYVNRYKVYQRKIVDSYKLYLGKIVDYFKTFEVDGWCIYKITKKIRKNTTNTKKEPLVKAILKSEKG